MKNTLVTLALGSAIPATMLAGEVDGLDYGYWVDWSSRHTSRGRDFLDGKGAFSQGVYMGLGHFGFELDRSGAMEDGTKELNFDFYYFREFESFSISGAYEFSDWESSTFKVDGSSFSIGVTYFDLPAGLWLAGDVEYSIDRDGFFSELSLGLDYEFNDRLTLTPAMSVGYNAGFFDEGHDGLNHLVASLSADYLLTDFLKLSASASYNWALNRESDFARYPDDALLGDFFWTGLTLSVGRNREDLRGSASSWQMALGTSVWASSMSGSISIGSGRPGVVRAANDSYDQAHTGLSFEARHGPWSILVDGSYVSFGAEVPPPLPVFSATPVAVRMAGVGLLAGYRIYESDRGNIDLLGGFRYFHLETEYQFSTPESRKLNWFDPIVGVRGQWEVSKNLLLSGRFETGWVHQFVQVDFGLEYQLSDHLSVDFGYRAFQIDEGSVHPRFKGPRIEASYRF